jgi:hypothetical protein
VSSASLARFPVIFIFRCLGSSEACSRIQVLCSRVPCTRSLGTLNAWSDGKVNGFPSLSVDFTYVAKVSLTRKEALYKKAM